MEHRKTLAMKQIPYLLFVLPAFLGYALFYLYPVLSSFVYSFTDWYVTQPVISFVGLRNYIRVLGDEQVSTGIINSLIYAVCMTIGQNVCAIVLAVFLDKKLISKNLLRMTFFAPAVLSPLVVGYLWSFMMSPLDYGMFNQILGTIGIDKINWLGDSNIALYSIIFSQIWQWSGWAMVIYLANLQTIPQEFYEAAKIDGANRWQEFWKITFPMLAPGFTINCTLSIINSLKVYDIIFSMTGGGPGHSTETIVMSMIQRGFAEGQYGFSAAIGIVLFMIVAVIALPVLKILRKREENIS